MPSSRSHDQESWQESPITSSLSVPTITIEEANNDAQILEYLRLCDLGRYIEEDILEQLASEATTADIIAGSIFEPWKDRTPRLALVIEGAVSLRVHAAARTASYPSTQKPGHQLPKNKDTADVLKIVKPGGYLNSTLQLLKSLSIPGSIPRPAAFGGDPNEFVYQALDSSRIAYIPLIPTSMVDPVTSIIIPGVRALVTKLYKSTFHHSRFHFLLHEEVLSSELRFQRAAEACSPPLTHSLDYSFANDFAANLDGKQSQTQSIFPMPVPGSPSPSPPAENVQERQHLLRVERKGLRLRTRSPVGIHAHQAFRLQRSGRMETPTKKTAVDEATELNQRSAIHESAQGAVLRAIGIVKSCLLPRTASLVQDAMADLELHTYGEGDVVHHQDTSYLGLYVVLEGKLHAEANIESLEGSAEPRSQLVSLGVKPTFEPGHLFGYSSLVLDTQAMFQFTAITKSAMVAFLPRQAVRLIADSCPAVMILLGCRMADALHPIIRMTDMAMDWLTIPGGSNIYSSGDEGDSIYFVVRGRVRTTEEISGTAEKRLVETSQGRSFGALEIYTGAPRPNTVTAVRNTDVARLQKSSYNSLVNYHPPLALNLWGKILSTASNLVRNHSTGSDQASHFAHTCPPRSITILPLSVDVPIETFVQTLLNALVAAGGYTRDKIVTVTSENITDLAGRRANFTRAGNAYLEDCLSNLQNMAQLTILLGDHAPHSTWNSTCIANSDNLILLGMADSDPKISEIEERIMQSTTTASKILVLLECKKEVAKDCGGLTRPWVEKRSWIVPGPLTGLQRLSLGTNQETHDIERLARRIAGKSVALVLGGGGARGFSHLGVLEAFEERGIPIDILGGTSMGAFVGALYAREQSFDDTLAAARAFASGGSWWHFLWDLTLPILSVTTGSHFSGLVKSGIGEATDASDLRIPYYCSVTDLMRNASAKTLHALAQPLWPMVRASMSVPGLVPPMSLGGDLLVDGCFSSNLPVFPSLSLGADLIFAFDVSTKPEAVPIEYTGMRMSGWSLAGYYLLSLFCTSWSRRNLPTYSQTNELLRWSTSLADIRAITRLPNCLYFLQPLKHIGSKTMNKLEEARSIGYENAKKVLDEWEEQGRLDGILTLRRDTRLEKKV